MPWPAPFTASFSSSSLPAKVVSISSVQSAASSLPALSLSLAFLLFAPELTGSLDTYRFAHKGESAPTPIALVLRRACKGQGSCNARSEEHTSELQSLMRISYAVFCLKKENTTITPQHKKS